MPKLKYTALACAFYLSGILSLVAGSGDKSSDEIRKAIEAQEAAKRALYDGHEFLSRDGLKEAETDIAKGTPKYKEYGRELAEPYRQARDSVFMERFGIQHEQLAGCFVSEPLVTYAKAYNARILKYVTEKFGEVAWQEANVEASRRIEEIQKKKNG